MENMGRHLVRLGFLLGLFNLCSCNIDFETTPILIAKNGYPVEVHEVHTADGYILTLHRIPGTKTQGYDRSLLPVFLQHGLMDSSSGWVLRGEPDALAYTLARNGYDVWLGNYRGNTYSKRHVYLTPDKKEFWDWSWHEMGLYDLPAAIDYVLIKTGRSKLNYIGHSMGTTAFFVMTSIRSDYNNKINQMIALAPVAYMSHTKSPIHILARHSVNFKHILDHLGNGEFVPVGRNELISSLKLACQQLPAQKRFCEHTMFIFTGQDEEQFDREMLSTIVKHNPASTSTKSVVHYAQGVQSAKFREFDYGLGNVARYNKSLVPPDYNLSKITARVSLIHSDNDLLAQPADVIRLHRELPNSKLYRVNASQFNHMDFLWARDLKTLVNDKVLDLLSQNSAMNNS